MNEYRVYKSGEEHPVRVARKAHAAGKPRPPGPPGRTVGAAGRPRYKRVSTRRAWLAWLSLGVCVAALALFVLYGRDALANTQAALDIARASGKVPRWILMAAPALIAATVALVAAYVAFGRRVVLKTLGLAAVVALLAAPGVAVGWANGLAGTVNTKPADRVAVAQARGALSHALPGKPMNILLIGSDKSGPSDPGRSDTQMLVRLDPQLQRISVLSLPRDLRVDIPGVGWNKMNAAYAYGGPKLVIQTFTQVTGIPINHYVQVNFAGFWHMVNILGGVYIPVDKRYYNPVGSGYKSIDMQPGYQLLDGKNALNFVRFRHDQQGDFTRMARQQLFIKELQRQSSRWSGNWSQVVALIKAITSQTQSDIDSLQRLEPLVSLVFAINTSKVYTVHLEGSMPMIDGVCYVVASQAQIAQAVSDFENPPQVTAKTSAPLVPKTQFTVSVYNAGAAAGYATAAAGELQQQGYRTQVLGNAPEMNSKATVVIAPSDLTAAAQAIGALMSPSDVRLVARAPGVDNAVSVFTGSSFGGQIALPTQAAQTQLSLVKERYDVAEWRRLAASTPLRLEMPTLWSSSLAYQQFRAYSIQMGAKRTAKRTAAAVVVGQTPTGSYFDIQAMRWTNPPAIAHPNSSQVIAGTRYAYFYQDSHVHMVSWLRHGVLYWIVNGLDNGLSNDVMEKLATSFAPVK